MCSGSRVVSETNQDSEISDPCCHNESSFCESGTMIVPENGAQVTNSDPDACRDIFPGVSCFRRRFMSNFIFTYVNIKSFRHKFAPSSEILSKILLTSWQYLRQNSIAVSRAHNFMFKILPCIDKIPQHSVVVWLFISGPIYPTEDLNSRK